MRHLGRLTTATVIAIAALILPTAMPASADPPQTVQDGLWRHLADQAYAEAVAAEQQLEANGQNIKVLNISALAWYAGLRFGWQDSRTQAWLGKVYQRRTASLGYGIGVAWDAYSDGSTNPADTTYTITTSYHVGAVLIAGHDAGGVAAARVTEAAVAELDTGNAGGGNCIAYSKHVNDAGKACVWNVSAAGAWFVEQARARGLVPAARTTEAATKVAAWKTRVQNNYSASLGGWTYQAGSSGLQDSWHNAPTVQLMYALDPAFGQTALAGHFRNWPNNTGANVALLPLDCSKVDANYEAARVSATQPTSTLEARLSTRATYVAGALLVQNGCAT